MRRLGGLVVAVLALTCRPRDPETADLSRLGRAVAEKWSEEAESAPNRCVFWRYKERELGTIDLEPYGNLRDWVGRRAKDCPSFDEIAKAQSDHARRMMGPMPEEPTPKRPLVRGDIDAMTDGMAIYAEENGEVAVTVEKRGGEVVMWTWSYHSGTVTFLDCDGSPRLIFVPLDEMNVFLKAIQSQRSCGSLPFRVVTEGAAELREKIWGHHCCRICTRGEACGDSCIDPDYTCEESPGCAC
jgi:hypothetical protein